MSRIYYINARKLVQLEQVEIEADSEEDAVDAYLNMAKRGDVEISDHSWYALDKGDLDVEDHGEGKNEPF